MKRGISILVCCLALLGAPRNGWAIPNSFFGAGPFFGPVIPAQPVFGRDLTVAFFERENWEKSVFPGPWIDQPSLGDQNVRRMTANPTLFGAVPMSVYSYGDLDSGTRQLAIHFLDAGLYFGYQYGGEKTQEQKMAGDDRRSSFSRHYRELSVDLRRRLEEGCGPGTLGSIGRSDELRTVYTQYQWDDYVLRFVTLPDHSVSIYIMKKESVPTDFFDTGIQNLRSEEKEEYFSSKANATENGDIIIGSLPMFTQGNTPFCGIHSLAMTGHYLGLRIPPEALAAGAEFRNTGSAKGSRMIDLYRSVGQEIDMKVSTSPKFDLKRVQQSIEDGIPVIVWRRVSKEREIAHNEFQQAFLRNPALTIDTPGSKNPAQYPRRNEKGSPSHASVVNGFNLKRNEVIFTEPWGEFSRNRRMLVVEMEATAYAVFYFKW